MAAKMAMIAITTSSSISVNPLFLPERNCVRERQLNFRREGRHIMFVRTIYGGWPLLRKRNSQFEVCLLRHSALLPVWFYEGVSTGPRSLLRETPTRGIT